MVAISDLLMEMSQAGIRLQVVSGQLRYRPRSAMTPWLAGQLKAHKAEVIATLKGELPRVSHGQREVQRFLRVCIPHADGRGATDPRYRGVIESLRNMPPYRGVSASERPLDDDDVHMEPTSNSERHKQLQADMDCFKHWVRHG